MSADSPLRRTLYFPVSGDPIGFHHFAAADWLLRCEPELSHVVFVLSNGIHPDPTKPDARAPAAIRLELLLRALREVGDPACSLLARAAERGGGQLRIGPESASVSERELAVTRAVRTAETVAALRRAAGGDERVRWFGGSDLVRRMASREIFSDEDLAFLAKACELMVLEREGDPVEDALARVARERRVELRVRAHALEGVPAWLAPFLRLSSTHIRRAAEAADPLGGMLPAPAAQWLVERAVYDREAVASQLTAPDGGPLRSRLELDCSAAEASLREAAGALAEALDVARAAGAPHTLALVETSSGGLATAALAGRSGASRFFRQARFAYDGLSKQQLAGDAVDLRSSVSGEMVAALAEAIRREASTDFGVAESGMAGPPDGRRRSAKSGICWLAFATPSGTRTELLELHPFQTRREHQLAFSERMLRGLAERI